MPESKKKNHKIQKDAFPPHQEALKETKMTEPDTEDELTYAPSETKTKPGKLDFSRFRLSQDFLSQGGAKKLLTTVPVRKPNRQQFIRVCSASEFFLDTLLLEYGESKETYLIEPEVQHLVEATPTRLVLAVDRGDNSFIWPLKLPQDDGRQTNWHLSALEALKHAKENGSGFRRTWVWVPMKSSRPWGSFLNRTGLMRASMNSWR